MNPLLERILVAVVIVAAAVFTYGAGYLHGLARGKGSYAKMLERAGSRFTRADL